VAAVQRERQRLVYAVVELDIDQASSRIVAADRAEVARLHAGY
jgi:hypothetical protein